MSILLSRASVAQWVGALLRVSFRDSVAGVRYPELPTVENSSGLKLLPCVGASGCVSQPAGKFAKANKHYRLITHTIQSQIQHSLYANHTLHSTSLSDLSYGMEQGVKGYGLSGITSVAWAPIYRFPSLSPHQRLPI